MTKQTPGEPEYFDKNRAADYVGITPATIRYHLYDSHFLPVGRLLYGRRMWTKDELETLKANLEDSRKLTKNPDKISAAALCKNAALMGQLKAGTIRLTYKGMKVLGIERSYNSSREYWLKVEDDADCVIFGNTRLSIKSEE